MDARINPGVTRFFGDLDNDPTAFGTLLSANYAIAASSKVMEAYRVMFDKDALARVEVPLGFDPGAYTREITWRSKRNWACSSRWSPDCPSRPITCNGVTSTRPWCSVTRK